MKKFTGILIAAFLFSVFTINAIPQITVIALLALATIYFIRQKIDKDMRKKIAVLFLITFILQLSTSLFMYNATVDTEYDGFSHKGDDFSYGNFGDTVGDLWRRGIFPSIKELDYYNFITIPGGDVQNYQLYNAFIFYLFGAVAGQILLIINCFLHAAIIIPVYFLCRDLNIKNSVMTFIFFLFLFWPSTFYWSLINFKESVILFTLFAIFALCTEIRKKARFIHVFYLAILMLIAFLVRRYLFIIFPITILYFFIFKRWKHKNAVILTIFLFLIILQLWAGVFSDIYAKLGHLPTELFKTRFAGDEASTSYFINFLTLTYTKTVLYFPLGLAATLILPFLLRPFTLFQVLSNVESVLWWCILPFLFGGIWISLKTLRKTFLILTTFFCWLSMLALTQGNMGTLIRQKSLIYYIGFVLIGLAIDRALKDIRISGNQAVG